MTRDPGLQPERTALSWQRTGLSAGMISVLTALAAVHLGMLPIAICGALVSVATMLVALVHFPKGVLHTSGRVYAGKPLTRIVAVVTATAVLGAAIAITSLLSSLLA